MQQNMKHRQTKCLLHETFCVGMLLSELQRLSSLFLSLQYYSDQFSMLAESLARERENAAARDEARAKVSRHSPPPTPPPVCVCLQLSGQLGRETRQRLEREVTDLQTCLDRDDDVTHFRELDAQQLKLALHHLLTPL